MFPPNHLHRTAIVIKLSQTFRSETSRLDQGRVERKGVMSRRQKKAIQIWGSRAVVAGSAHGIRIMRTWYVILTKRQWDHGTLARTQVHTVHVEGCEYLGSRTGLAEIPTMLDGMFKNAQADAMRCMTHNII